MFIIRHDPRSAASRLAVFGNVVLSAFPYTACSVLVTRSAALGIDPVQHFSDPPPAVPKGTVLRGRGPV